MTETAAGAGKKLDEITILAPNGVPEEFKFHPQHTVEKTLDQAIKEFSKKGQLDGSVPYILVMGATPLEPSLTLERAGVIVGATLKVRAKQTPGDGDAPRAV